MVVVVIIGILASLAVPQIVERLRERRANQAAQEIALMYRNARMRAVGQGFAVLVRYNATGFEVRQALPPAAGACTLQLPPSCTTNLWLTPGTDYRVIDAFNANNYPGVTEAVTAGTGAVTALDLCFSPRGRTFSRTNPANVLNPTAGMTDVAVSRTAVPGKIRRVSILPNGMARLAL